MVIQGDFFQLIPSSEYSLNFDLKLLYKIKGKNPREEYKDAGYGLSLETELKKCIQYAIVQKYDVLSLKEYLHEFKKIQKDIAVISNGEDFQIDLPIKPSL